MTHVVASLLLFLAVTGEATGPRVGVNTTGGAAPLSGAREARMNCPAASVPAGFGVTETAGGVRGHATGNPNANLYPAEWQNDGRPYAVENGWPAMAVSAATLVNPEDHRA